jgi:hypothetical protein
MQRRKRRSVLKNYRFVCTALLVATLGACAAPVAQTWTDFRSPEHGFSVAFPGGPQLTQRTPHGRIPVIEYQYQVASVTSAFNVSVVEFGPGHGVLGDGTVLLNALVDDYAKGSGATVRTRSSSTLSGHNAIEAVLEDPAHGREHLIDLVAERRRVYLVASAGPIGNSTSADARRFRDSLRLLGE